MVISFQSDKAFALLKELGFVITFRKNKRKNPYGKTWCNRQRGGTKEFDVYVVELTKATLNDNYKPLNCLEVFLPISGFSSKEEWRQEIIELNGELPEEGYFYLVKRIDNIDN